MAGFDPGFSHGQTVTNEEIRTVFKCSGVGSMRRSRATGSLVLITGEAAGPYRDRWEEDRFHFTARGLKGDQQIDALQNKTLAESNSNGIAVYLFESAEGDRLVFVGRMQLAGEPYSETQPDEDGDDRRAWVFPLASVTGPAAVAAPGEAQPAVTDTADGRTTWWQRFCAKIRGALGR